MSRIINVPAIESIEVGHRLSFAEFEMLGDGEKVAQMDGFSSRFEVWHLEQSGDPRIIAVEYPTGGTGKHPGVTVVAVGADSEYPRILADVTAMVVQIFKENWG